MLFFRINYFDSIDLQTLGYTRGILLRDMSKYPCKSK